MLPQEKIEQLYKKKGDFGLVAEEVLSKKTSVNLPFKVYTEEEALNLGLIKKSNTTLYIEGAAILLVAWLIWRAIKKRRKNNRRNLNG